MLNVISKEQGNQDPKNIEMVGIWISSLFFSVYPNSQIVAFGGSAILEKKCPLRGALCFFAMRSKA